MKRHRAPFVLKEMKMEVTYSCALNCVHCSSDASPSNALEMNREDCLRILEEAKVLGASRVAFSGGEPLLWPGILDAVHKACSLGFEVSIYSSGVIPEFKEVASQVQQRGASRFIFSIFGATSEGHERITRRTGSFDRTVHAVKAASAIGMEVELHFVPMNGNYRELRGIAALARDLKVARISVLRLVPQGRAALAMYQILSRLQNVELREQIETLRNEGHDIRTGSPYNFLMVNSAPACSAAIDRLIVGPDLRIYPCDAFKRISSLDLVGTEDLSSLKDAGLAECWEKSPYLCAIRRFLTTDFQPPCSSCDSLEHCLSGCLAQKVIASRSLAKCPDPDCILQVVHGGTD